MSTSIVACGVSVPGAYSRDTVSSATSTARTLRSKGHDVSIVVSKHFDDNSISFIRELCPDYTVEIREA